MKNTLGLTLVCVHFLPILSPPGEVLGAGEDQDGILNAV
jgi:hypothetical protein